MAEIQVTAIKTDTKTKDSNGVTVYELVFIEAPKTFQFISYDEATQTAILKV